MPFGYLHRAILDRLQPWCELESFLEYCAYTGALVPKHTADFFLDSGTFSISTGLPPFVRDNFNREGYVEYLLKYADQLTAYANFDVIPTEDSDKEPWQCAEETWDNQMYMESFGLKPIPVFHSGEPWEYLERYLDKYEYIAVGFRNSEHLLDELWDRYLADSNGRPRCKVHAFGLMAVQRITKYPWYSCDSRTWLSAARCGAILVPQKIDGQYCYNVKPLLFVIGKKSVVMRSQYGKHYDTFPKIKKDYIEEYLSLKGYDIKQCIEYRDWRAMANMHYFIDLSRNATFTDVVKKRQVILI